MDEYPSSKLAKSAIWVAAERIRLFLGWQVLSSIAPGRSGWSDIRRPMIRPLPEDQRNAVRGV